MDSTLELLTQICLATFVCTLLAQIYYRIKKYVVKPTIWVIDDTVDDLELFHMYFKDSGYIVKYFTSPDSIQMNLALSPPNAVIADYLLRNHQIKGDMIYSYCKKSDIPVVIVTGFDGAINHIPESSVIRKHSPNFYKTLTEWLHTKVTTHA